MQLPIGDGQSKSVVLYGLAKSVALHYPGRIYEPDWRSGKAIATRIARADGETMGIAGLWEQWRNPGTGVTVHSVTMLTINSDNHPFIRNYHKPEDEKRMVVILPQGLYGD